MNSFNILRNLKPTELQQPRFSCTRNRAANRVHCQKAKSVCGHEQVDTPLMCVDILLWMHLKSLAIGTIVCLFATTGTVRGETASSSAQPTTQVCFSPPAPGGCDPQLAIVSAIKSAQRSVLVQAYALTSREITAALIAAKKNHREVQVIVDRRQLREDRAEANAVSRLETAGIRVLVDSPPSGIAHNKVILIDREIVITGSYNFSAAAETRNAENLLIIRDPKVAASYEQNWRDRAERSRPLQLSSTDSAQPDKGRRYAARRAGPVVGNRRSLIYEWPGCPDYSKISPRNRVEFANAATAEASGYRAAQNCR